MIAVPSVANPCRLSNAAAPCKHLVMIVDLRVPEIVNVVPANSVANKVEEKGSDHEAPVHW